LKSFLLKNSSFSGEVEAVVVPGTEGEFTVLKDHAPLISSLKPGVVVIEETPAKKLRLFVPGGFAEVATSGLTSSPIKRSTWQISTRPRSKQGSAASKKKSPGHE